MLYRSPLKANYVYNLQLNDLQQKKNLTVILGATKMEGLKCHIFSCHNQPTNISGRLIKQLIFHDKMPHIYIVPTVVMIYF